MSDVEVTHAIRVALRAKYAVENLRTAPRGVLLEEVRNATGFDATRSAHAIALSFWPSDGLAITGYEIKASRADWLRELKAPEKAYAFARYCDFWWVATASVEMVRPEELPPMWGLMVLNARGKLHHVVPAQKLTAEPMSRAMLMALVRTVCTATWEPLVEKASADRVAQDRARAERELSRHQRDLTELRTSVEKFEASSGVRIDRYEGGRIGEVVALVRNVLTHGYGGAINTVDGHVTVLRRLLSQCEDARAELERLQSAGAGVASWRRLQ